jgi:hypothetical protein
LNPPKGAPVYDGPGDPPSWLNRLYHYFTDPIPGSPESLGGQLVPVVGPARDAVAAGQDGRYTRMVVSGGLALLDLTGLGLVFRLRKARAVGESVEEAAKRLRPPKSAKEILDQLPGKSGKTGPIKTVKDEEALNCLYETLTKEGKLIDSGNYPGVVKELPDGTIVRKRPISKSGGTTLDITLPDGKIIKVHTE